MAEYDADEILKEMLSGVPDTLSKREGDVIYRTLAPTARLLARQNFLIGFLTDLLFPDTATGEWLDRAAYNLGVEREPATRAVRRIATVDSGGNPLDVPAGSRFAVNGLIFALGERVGPGEYRAVCEQAGTDGNLYGGAILPVDNLSGLGAATLDPAPIVTARDAETDNELRERLFRKLRQSPFGGNRADYEEKALAIDGVGAVAVFAAPVMGGGHVGLVIGDERQNRASPELVDEVQTLFGTDGDGLAPLYHTVAVTTCTDLPVDVAAPLRLRAGTSLAVVKPAVEQVIAGYIENTRFRDETVFHAKLVAAILGAHEAVMDVGAVTLNGKAENLPLEKIFANYQVPTVGAITVTEAG